jgi:IclR family transcriptional regulator, acetate operon repressor
VDRRWAVYTAMAESRQAIRHVSWLGQRIRRAGSAVGAALAGDVDTHGVCVRHDAVEPGVTAVSIPLRAGDEIAAAISVVGPSFRLKGNARRTATRALTDAVGRIAPMTPGDDTESGA